MAAPAPKDKFRGVWLIFFMLGLGTLLPWNFFMTATQYFTGRLKDIPGGAPTTAPPIAAAPTAASPNQTEAKEEELSVLQAKFNNVMTLCAMVPLLLCTCLNSFLHSRIPQKLRVMGSLLVIMSVFALTAALVKVAMDPLPFFTVTMVKIVIINSFGAVLQGSLFGMAGRLPQAYTAPIMSGQGLAGTFAAAAMICAIASGSPMQDAAFGYFVTACVVILFSVLSYVVLPRLEFFQYYQETPGQRRPSQEANTITLMDREGRSDAAEPDPHDNISMMEIFKKIWVLALSVCFAFTVTIGTFPAITADTKSTLADGGAWKDYFIPVCCFLLFNLCDWGGRSLTAFCMWPGKDSRLLPLLMVCRVAFVPLFMLCNVHPRSTLPVYFHHDGWFVVFMVLFAFSNGYLASLCMCYGPKKVLPHEAETAGSIMAFFLSLGLALGAALSFLLRALV